MLPQRGREGREGEGIEEDQQGGGIKEDQQGEGIGKGVTVKGGISGIIPMNY